VLRRAISVHAGRHDDVDALIDDDVNDALGVFFFDVKIANNKFVCVFILLLNTLL